MFDWIVELLYGITKSILRLIDGLVSCCNKLSGIETVNIDGQDTDFMSWVISLDAISIGFKAAALVCTCLVVFFTIWQICKTIVSEKPEKTPAQLCIQAGKSILTFMFVPVIMITLVWALNEVALVMYNGTSGGSTKGIGTYLAAAFGESAVLPGVSKDFYLQDNFDYTNTSLVETYLDLWDYDFFYSWVAGFAILFTMTKAIMIFIDRVFSIALLFIISPFPIAAAVVDEGQHFKLWREQLLAKFLVGYGTLIGLNIYGIVVAGIASADIEFFSNNSFLDWLFKLAIILGGTVSLSRISTMIGNIVANGAGDTEAKNAEDMHAGIKGIGKGVAGIGKKLFDKVFGNKDDKGGGENGNGGNGGGDAGNNGNNGNNGSRGNKNQTRVPLENVNSGQNVVKEYLEGINNNGKPNNNDPNNNKGNQNDNKKPNDKNKKNILELAKGSLENTKGGSKK